MLNQLLSKLNLRTVYMCLVLTCKIVQIDTDPTLLQLNFKERLIQIYENRGLNEVLQKIMFDFGDKRIGVIVEKINNFIQSLTEDKNNDY